MVGAPLVGPVATSRAGHLRGHVRGRGLVRSVLASTAREHRERPWSSGGRKLRDVRWSAALANVPESRVWRSSGTFGVPGAVNVRRPGHWPGSGTFGVSGRRRSSLAGRDRGSGEAGPAGWGGRRAVADGRAAELGAVRRRTGPPRPGGRPQRGPVGVDGVDGRGRGAGGRVRVRERGEGHGQVDGVAELVAPGGAGGLRGPHIAGRRGHSGSGARRARRASHPLAGSRGCGVGGEHAFVKVRLGSDGWRGLQAMLQSGQELTGRPGGRVGSGRPWSTSGSWRRASRPRRRWSS